MPLYKIECEKCNTIVAFRSPVEVFVDGAVQVGMSKKYPKYLATYCKKHSKLTRTLP